MVATTQPHRRLNGAKIADRKVIVIGLGYAIYKEKRAFRAKYDEAEIDVLDIYVYINALKRLNLCCYL